MHDTIGEALRGSAPREALLEDLLAAVVAPELDGEAGRAAARRVLGDVGELGRWGRLGAAELVDAMVGRFDEPGASALRVLAAIELGRRFVAAPLPRGAPIDCPTDVADHLRGLLSGALREAFVVVLLDGKHRPIRSERVSEGCLTWSVVHPREVFAPAVRESAGAVIVAHNHPSGDPTPSRQDVEVTTRLAQAGELLGIPLLDHLVLAGDRCVSLRAQGALRGHTTPLASGVDDE